MRTRSLIKEIGFFGACRSYQACTKQNTDALFFENFGTG